MFECQFSVIISSFYTTKYGRLDLETKVMEEKFTCRIYIMEILEISGNFPF